MDELRPAYAAPPPPHRVSPDAFSHFVTMGINCGRLEHKVDKPISYIPHYAPDEVCLQEVWVDFPLECPASLPYRAVVSTPFRGRGLVVLFHVSRCEGGGGGSTPGHPSTHLVRAPTGAPRPALLRCPSICPPA